MAEIVKDFNLLSPWGALGRCVLNPDGTIAYFLDKDNSNLKADGVSANWTEVEELGQNVMVQVPKFYFSKKVIDNGNEIYFGVSTEPIDDEFISADEWQIHPAFYRDRTKLCDDQSAVPIEVDYRYVGAFKGWVDGNGRLRSLPNKMPTTTKTIGTFRTHAKNMGLGWSQFDFYLLYALQMLYITEYGHPDSQTKIGRGFVDGNSGAIQTGGTLDKGNNTFGETTGKKQMSYRGIEDFWGNVYDWIDGCFYDGSYNILISNKGFNDTGSGYTNVGKGSSLGGNVRTIQLSEETGFIGKTNGLSYETGGLYDYIYMSSGRLPCFGGVWSDGSNAGAFSLYSFSASDSYSAIGSRLVF